MHFKTGTNAPRFWRASYCKKVYTSCVIHMTYTVPNVLENVAKIGQSRARYRNINIQTTTQACLTHQLYLTSFVLHEKSGKSRAVPDILKTGRGVVRMLAQAALGQRCGSVGLLCRPYCFVVWFSVPAYPTSLCSIQKIVHVAFCVVRVVLKK
jgi:hypothetical protein